MLKKRQIIQKKHEQRTPQAITKKKKKLTTKPDAELH